MPPPADDPRAEVAEGIAICKAGLVSNVTLRVSTRGEIFGRVHDRNTGLPIRLRSTDGRLERILVDADPSAFNCGWEEYADVVDVDQLDPSPGVVLQRWPGVELAAIVRPLD